VKIGDKEIKNTINSSLSEPQIKKNQEIKRLQRVDRLTDINGGQKSVGC